MSGEEEKTFFCVVKFVDPVVSFFQQFKSQTGIFDGFNVNAYIFVPVVDSVELEMNEWINWEWMEDFDMNGSELNEGSVISVEWDLNTVLCGSFWIL